MPRHSPRVRHFGLWLLFAPRGVQNLRYFRDHRGGWLLTPFQRKLGIRYLPTSVYKRSVARMGDWKGGFFPYGKQGPPRSLLKLTAFAEGDAAARKYAKLFDGARRWLPASTGYAYLWAPRIRHVPHLPYARLVAIVPEKVRHWQNDI